MTEDSDVFDDGRFECFEPRQEDAGFSDVTLKSAASVDPADHPVQPLQTTQALSSITVDVGSPEKFSTFRETYIRYLVHAKSTREEFRNKEYEVHRRYNDFLWLRDRLEEVNPSIVIPPFPPKHSINSVDRFSGPFIIFRCKALQRFISRVCAHPVLSSGDDLFHFLTVSDDQYWQDYRRGHAVNGNYWNKVKSLVQNGETTPEFADIIPKLQRGRDAFEHLITASRQVNDEEQSLGREMSTMAAHYAHWSSQSGHIPRIGHILYQIGQILELQSQNIVPVSQCISTDFIPELNDLIAYSDCVKSVVYRRDRLQGTISDNRDTAENLERDLDTPSTLMRKIRRETVDEERSRREARLTELRSRTDSLSKHLTHANTDLKLEYEQWETHRRNETKQSLLCYARQRKEHHQRLNEEWMRLLENLDNADIRNGGYGTA